MGLLRARWARRIITLALGLGTIVASAFGVRAWQSRTDRDLSRLPRVQVRRADVRSTVSAGGQIESAARTLIECELESVSISSEGRSLSARAASQIIELIPEGTIVRKGNVLCRLDSSEFEEMLRQQEIKVEQARADYAKAGHDLEAAEIAVDEFKLGTLPLQRQGLEGQLALAEADMKRQQERLAWTDRMVAWEYLSDGQLLNERQTMMRAEINRERLRLQRETLNRFEGPTALMRLETAVIRAREELLFQEIRVGRRQEQLQRLRKQVDRCTIRAPHDGLVVYANTRDGRQRIELGTTVYQKMDLFYLPDLTRMEVHAAINESIVARVAKGMAALVRVEALPRQWMEGQVTRVASLPMVTDRRRGADDIKNFLARIELLSVPQGLRPGMSAQVEIITQERRGALVIPTAAVRFLDGQEFCYVPGRESLERRTIDTDPATPELLAVNWGLEEGEEVVAEVTAIPPGVPIVVSAPTIAADEPLATN
jgi:HlyD family secretion protein